MMKKPIILTAAGLLLSSHLALADDLENLLSDASEPVAKTATVAAKPASALALAIRQHLQKTNSEQNVLLRYIEAKDWGKAVLQYAAAFEGTSFQKSANGVALLGYLQFQAGLPVTGTETLFRVSDPKAIDSEIQKEWKEILPSGHFAWDLAQINWTPGWSSVFGAAPGFHLMAREVDSVKNAARLKKLAEAVPADSQAQKEIDWQLLLAYSVDDQTAEAGKILARLMKSAQAPVSQDLMQLTAGRLLYQNGNFDTAVKLYEKVPKGSEYWTEAQEEMAWSYVRKGEPQNALAISQSLINPALAYQVGPESFFVHSLSQLKICDYSGALKSMDQFSKQFKTRTLALNQVAKESNSKEAEAAIETLKKPDAGLKDLGSVSQRLPRLITKDSKLRLLAQAQTHLESEAKAADVLYAQSLAQTGLQSSFDHLKKQTSMRAQQAKSASVQRIQELAQDEVQETRDILRKMHIIEAEVIQQASLADRIAKNATETAEKKGSTGSKSADTLRFPLENEMWFDEISNYKVDVKKACHAKR